MQANFYVTPVPIWEFLDKVSKAMKDGFQERTVQHVSIGTSIITDSFAVKTLGKAWFQQEGLKEKIKVWKTRPYIHPNQIDVTLDQNWTVTYLSNDSGPGPILRLNVNDQNRDAGSELVLADALNKHFNIIQRTELASGSMPEAQLATFRFAEKVVATLAAETAKISQSSVVAFEQFVDGVKERTLELESEFQTKTTELNAQHLEKTAKLDSEFTAKLKDLESREKSHAEAVKQFELRNNTAVRRDLLKEIRAKIEDQKTIVISDATIQKRRIVHVVCAVTLFLSATLMGLFAHKIFTQTSVEWKLLIPMSSATLVFVMTGIYYIKWNDQWFRDHARVEFETRKFSSDILRASWIAELFFEWAEKKGVNMPPELVGSFTKNLFDSTASDGRLHPSDQLNDLIKEFSTLELSKGGVKVTRKEGKP